MVSQETRSPRISKIWTKNFRSIESVELHLDSLTVLVGPNASGKSNIVDVLRFMSDTVRNGLESSMATRRGDQVARRYSLHRKAIDVVVGLSFEDGPMAVDYDLVLRVYAGGGHKVWRETAEFITDDADTSSFGVDIRKGRLIKPNFRRPSKVLGKLNLQEGVEARLLEGANIGFPFYDVIPYIRFFSQVVANETYSEVQRATTLAHNHLLNMRFYHIFPDALREPQIIASKYPLEEHGENLASVLEDMKRKGSPYMPELLSALSQVVPGVVDVSVTRAGGHLVVKLLHQDRGSGGKGIWLDASQESDGTLRTLGLLVALYQDPTPPLIAIEEPELTIHPGALAVLAELILEASQRTSLLITTHSPELLDMLPVESIRSVESVDGATQVGLVADHQRNAVMKGLFSPGELHRIEGLQRATTMTD